MQGRIRLIQQADLTEVQAIQDRCYGDELFEDTALIERRLVSQPNSCWLAESSSGEVQAYLFSYPSRNYHVAALGSEFAQYAEADVLYLHDMAVAQHARGLGLPAKLLRYAEDYAASLRLDRLALVAVQGSVPYWQRQGFAGVNLSDAEAIQALASYSGQNAVYMQKLLLR